LRRFGGVLLRRFAFAARRCLGFATGRARTVVLAAGADRRRPAVRTEAARVVSGASAAPPPGEAGCGSLLVPETAAAARKPLAIRPMPSSTALSRFKARVEPARMSAPPARCAAASSPSVRLGSGLGRSAGTARTRVAKSGSTSTSSGLIGSITSCPLRVPGIPEFVPYNAGFRVIGDRTQRIPRMASEALRVTRSMAFRAQPSFGARR
jgi:hypothetical protein